MAKRKAKGFSHADMAFKLNLGQSYCRRESGEVRFAAEEIPILAKELETTVAQLYGEDTNSFTVHTQNGGNFGQYISVPQQLIEQYEARLKEKDEIITFLRKQLQERK